MSRAAHRMDTRCFIRPAPCMESTPMSIPGCLSDYHLVDRRKDMGISGGFNVYPKEVEDVIAQHPSVAAVAVIGVPDEYWGEAVKAVVVKHPGTTLESQELQALVRQAKGAVYTPKTIDFVAALPLTALGKPDKKQLRERFILKPAVRKP